MDAIEIYRKQAMHQLKYDAKLRENEEKHQDFEKRLRLLEKQKEEAVRQKEEAVRQKEEVEKAMRQKDEEHAREMALLSDTIKERDRRICELEAENQRLQSRVKVLEEENVMLRDRVKQLEKEMKEQKAEIDGLQAAFSHTKKTNERQQTEIHGLRAEIHGLEGETHGLRAEMHGLQESNSSIMRILDEQRIKLHGRQEVFVLEQQTLWRLAADSLRREPEETATLKLKCGWSPLQSRETLQKAFTNPRDIRQCRVARLLRDIERTVQDEHLWWEAMVETLEARGVDLTEVIHEMSVGWDQAFPPVEQFKNCCLVLKDLGRGQSHCRGTEIDLDWMLSEENLDLLTGEDEREAVELLSLVLKKSGVLHPPTSVGASSSSSSSASNL